MLTLGTFVDTLIHSNSRLVELCSDAESDLLESRFPLFFGCLAKMKEFDILT